MESTGLDMLSAAARTQQRPTNHSTQIEGNMTYTYLLEKKQTQKMDYDNTSVLNSSSRISKGSRRLSNKRNFDKLHEVDPMSHNSQSIVKKPVSGTVKAVSFNNSNYPILANQYYMVPSYINQPNVSDTSLPIPIPISTNGLKKYPLDISPIRRDSESGQAYIPVSYFLNSDDALQAVWKSNQTSYLMSLYQQNNQNILNNHPPSSIMSEKALLEQYVKERVASTDSDGKDSMSLSNADVLPEFNLRTLKNDTQTKLELVVLLLNERRLRKRLLKTS